MNFLILSGHKVSFLGLTICAISEFEKVIQLNPTDFSSYSWLGIIYSELKDTEKAVENFQKAKDLGDPNVEDYIKEYLGKSEDDAKKKEGSN